MESPRSSGSLTEFSMSTSPTDCALTYKPIFHAPTENERAFGSIKGRVICLLGIPKISITYPALELKHVGGTFEKIADLALAILSYLGDVFAQKSEISTDQIKTNVKALLDYATKAVTIPFIGTTVLIRLVGRVHDLSRFRPWCRSR